MSRRQVVGFVAVLALIGAALVLRHRSGPNASDLTDLRRAAALQPCPAGIGPGLPDLTLDCLGGGPAVTLRKSGPGTPMLVNMWATWCTPCVREVPVLVDFAQRAAGKVAVVGVDTEDESAKALTFARQYSMHYPSVVDSDGKVLRASGGGPPITLLVDATGKVVFTHRGELHKAADVDAMVAEHLGIRL